MVIVYELKVNVLVKEYLAFKKHLPAVVMLVDDCFKISDQWQKFHEENALKHYSVGPLQNIPKDKVYQKNQHYTFSIRTTNVLLFDLFGREMNKKENDALTVTSVRMGVIRQQLYTSLRTYSPATWRKQGGYWRLDDTIGIPDFLKQINKNLLRKYKHLTGIDLTPDIDNPHFDFATGIHFLNKQSIAMEHKHGTLSTDVFELDINLIQEAQELAYLAIGEGILNQNPRGYGFVNWKQV